MHFLTDIIPQDFLGGLFFIFKNYYPMFLEGMKYTIIISLTGTIFGLLIAMVIAPIKIQKVTRRDTAIVRIFKKIGVVLTTMYVEMIRGTPMIVQAGILYYALIKAGVEFDLNFYGKTVIPGIISFGIYIVSINTSAYITEVLRGSIDAIDKGQMEAARSLGMTKGQAMVHVIIPQALKNSIPAIGNEFVINIKDTAVLSIIGVSELLYMTRKTNGLYFRMSEGFTIAAILYLIMTLLTTRLLYYISKKSEQKKSTPFPLVKQLKRG